MREKDKSAKQPEVGLASELHVVHNIANREKDEHGDCCACKPLLRVELGYRVSPHRAPSNA